MEGCYCIYPSSPCAAENSPADCGLIGAQDIGIIAGDCNQGGVMDTADIVCVINFLYLGCYGCDPVEICDVNCDGVEDAADVIYKINYLLLGFSPPCWYCPQL
jgi:hypothetical protein